MCPSPLEYLQHIRDEMRFLVEATAGVTRTRLDQDETLKRAVVRSLEVIGEAARNVPEPYRPQHPEIPWRAMAGMRDRLTHGCFGVDYDLVWDAARNRVPEVQRLIEKAIAAEGGRST